MPRQWKLAWWRSLPLGTDISQGHPFFQRFNHWNVKASLILNQEFLPKGNISSNMLQAECGHLGTQTRARLAGQASELSVGFVFGLAGITRLFAGVAPIVCLGTGLVMPPRWLVEDRQAFEGLAGQGLQIDDSIRAHALHRVELQIPLEVSGIEPRNW